MYNKKHLSSPYWNRLREQAVSRSKQKYFEKYGKTCSIHGCCEQCFYDSWKPNLQLHHLSYENFGHESLNDVILLCPWCHKKVHGKE